MKFGRIKLQHNNSAMIKAFRFLFDEFDLELDFCYPYGFQWSKWSNSKMSIKISFFYSDSPFFIFAIGSTEQNPISFYYEFSPPFSDNMIQMPLTELFYLAADWFKKKLFDILHPCCNFF